MTAHFLIVEDDYEFANTLVMMISRLPGEANIKIAKSRDAACAALDNEFYDFLILDLRIPTHDDALDADPLHGKYVFHYARRTAPGMKLLVLTGSPSEDFISDLLAQKRDADIWSEGTSVNTVEFLRKIDIEDAPTIISSVKSAVNALSDIELSSSKINLQTGEDRLIRIFAKRLGARRCQVSPIGEGKSGAKPLRLQLFDAQGTPFRQSFAKLGQVSKFLDESERHDKHVILLDGVATPRKLSVLEFGASTIGGIFYQLADGYDQSIFEVIAEDPARAGEIAGIVAKCLSQWSRGIAESRHQIADIRRCWVADSKATELQSAYGLDWAVQFEAREIQARWRCVHGDLHGGNILVSAADGAVLIDYGDVQHSAVSYDPVSLELSCVLQDNPSLSDSWPSETQCRHWHQIDVYTSGTPLAPFIQSCRSWAEEAAAGRREVAASAYAYLLRQLKYEDTDKGRIIALMEGVRSYIAQT